MLGHWTTVFPLVANTALIGIIGDGIDTSDRHRTSGTSLRLLTNGQVDYMKFETFFGTNLPQQPFFAQSNWRFLNMDHPSLSLDGPNLAMHFPLVNPETQRRAIIVEFLDLHFQKPNYQDPYPKPHRLMQTAVAFMLTLASVRKDLQLVIALTDRWNGKFQREARNTVGGPKKPFGNCLEAVGLDEGAEYL
ncbi:hypothetical protein H4R33_003470, partial [Dimargaris cristalligena]